MILRARHFEFGFPRPTLLMGIVNVTPDSFSDGGCFLDKEAAVAHALQLAQEGAEIIDIGGESTRPRATPVDEAEELRRVLPVLERLQGQTGALISIDTYKVNVAREAIAAGAAMINDVRAGQDDPRMWELAAESGAAYVAMHMQGHPATMQQDPTYKDVRREVGEFLSTRLTQLAAAGVALEQTLVDVGIGFGKKREHNLQLLAGLGTLSTLQRPVVIGVSRKSFLGPRLAPGERLPAALAAACWAVEQGVQIIRTHDVTATLQAVRMTEEIREILLPQA